MKAERTKNITLCDSCNAETNYPYRCLGCGKEFCYNCYEKVGIGLNHGVHFFGSGDGYFCNTCVADMPEKIKPLFNAYLKVKVLRLINNTFYSEFGKEEKEAEEKVRELYDKQNK